MTDADKPLFLQAFSRLCVSLREKEPDAVQLRVYFKALSEVDLELVMMAAEHLEKHAQWFPKTSEWIDAAKHIEQTRIEQQRQAIRSRLVAGIAPLCLVCVDTGWEPVANGVKRCACQHARRLEILGRRPLPELPAAKPEPSLEQLAKVQQLLVAAKGMK
jgi:hypothetical protein